MTQDKSHILLQLRVISATRSNHVHHAHIGLAACSQASPTLELTMTHREYSASVQCKTCVIVYKLHFG